VPHGTRSRIPAPDKVAETSELRGILKEAIAALPEVQQEVVLLHDLEGWKHREIAERLGIPSGTVRSHLHFARKALKQALIQMPDGSDLIRKVQ
jgi:RNA polymerase sigma-70 factor (ECF subfamily)